MADAKPQEPKGPPSQTVKEEALSLAFWPHIRTDESIPRIMRIVFFTLLPACGVGVYLFGWDGLQVLLTCTIAAVLTEAVVQRMMGVPVTIHDWSAAVTGLLLGMNMPPGAPWWLSVTGSVIAIGLAKQLFGGVGYNVFNPALVGRVALLIAFPVQMTVWQLPHPIGSGIDVMTGATPLGEFQLVRLMPGSTWDETAHSLWTNFLGLTAGSVGETSELALLIGAAVLLYRRYITWHIPVSMIAGTALLTGVFWLMDPTQYASPHFHLLTGGFVLATFFMATDMVTCPTTPRGQLVFGFGCGLLTAIIRTWGGYPEGVSFAIVVMNSLVVLIDRVIQPARYGTRR